MKYVAFLRAVNVGKRQIKMVDLKEMFEAVGFQNVQTFIASGNVTFESEERNKKVLIEKIENEIEKKFDFHSEVMLRTINELQQIIAESPFKDIPLDKNTILYVGFLYNELDASSIKKLAELNNEVDTLKVKGYELYALRYRDKGESILNTNFLSKYIQTPMTMRNWNTIVKINLLLST